MATATQRRAYAYDSELQLKDSYAVTTGAAAQVASADKIIAVGNAFFKGVAVIDVTVIDIASNDEIYDIIIQGSTSSTFADTIQNLAQLNLGATESRLGGAIDSTVGRYEVFFCNEADGITYPYIRAYTALSGTTETITYSAYVSKDMGGC